MPVAATSPRPSYFTASGRPRLQAPTTRRAANPTTVSTLPSLRRTLPAASPDSPARGNTPLPRARPAVGCFPGLDLSRALPHPRTGSTRCSSSSNTLPHPRPLPCDSHCSPALPNLCTGRGTAPLFQHKPPHLVTFLCTQTRARGRGAVVVAGSRAWA